MTRGGLDDPWTLIQPLPFAISGLRSITIQTARVLMIGGYVDSQGGNTDKIYEMWIESVGWDPTWTSYGRLELARAVHSVSNIIYEDYSSFCK